MFMNSFNLYLTVMKLDLWLIRKILSIFTTRVNQIELNVRSQARNFSKLSGKNGYPLFVTSKPSVKQGQFL